MQLLAERLCGFAQNAAAANTFTALSIRASRFSVINAER